MNVFYNIFIHLLDAALKIKAVFNGGIRDWNKLRQDHFEKLDVIKSKSNSKKIIWMHCASLGEYEQGIPVLRNLKNKYTNHFFILSFFSPSGYLQKYQSEEADEIIYLPIDTYFNAHKIISTLQPAVFIGVKYELWWNLLNALQKSGCKIIYLSVFLQKPKYFLKINYFKNILQRFHTIFTQDQNTKDLFDQYNFQNVVAAIDTRTISVLDRKTKTNKLSDHNWIQTIDLPILVYGSIYHTDLPYINNVINNNNFFHILVPHQVNQSYIKKLQKEIPGSVLWSEIKEPKSTFNIVIVDVIGILFDLYRYAFAAYVGGGFEKSVHNTLEPAVHLIPVAFGPMNSGFLEIKDFLHLGVASVINDESSLINAIQDFQSVEIKTNLQTCLTDYFESKKTIYEQMLTGIYKIIG